jgi:hypothetical protein
MSESMPTADRNEASPPPEPLANPSQELRQTRLWPFLAGGLLFFVGAAIVAGVIWVMDRPVLVPVSGRIRFDGPSLDNAFVLAIPNRGGQAALSPLDADGNFSLMTNGADGALTGEHRLVVKAFTRGMPPQLIVPSKYADEATTPWTIKVKKGAANHFEFEIETP